jgi:hypothetical protein
VTTGNTNRCPKTPVHRNIITLTKSQIEYACGSVCGRVIEPLKRFELSTSSLPRKCSTPELQRHIGHACDKSEGIYMPVCV